LSNKRENTKGGLLRGLVVFSILLLSLYWIGYGGVGEGGLEDSTVVVKFDRGMWQTGAISSYDASSKRGGNVLFSEAIYFDISVDVGGFAYTRGIEDLEDSVKHGGHWGGRALNLENWVGEWMTLVCYKAEVGTLRVTVEQAPYYDSTFFSGITGANYGYYSSDTLFDGSLEGGTGGGVEIDSFQIFLPIVRFVFGDLTGDSTNAFHFVGYHHREFPDPQGEFRKIEYRGR